MKVGAISFCPKCGTSKEAGQQRCLSCGFVYMDIDPNRASIDLFNRIQSLRSKYEDIRNKNNVYRSNSYSKENEETAIKRIKDEEVEAISSLIRDYPVPSDKETLIEFITSLQPKTLDKQDILAKAYKQKLKEAINKAEIYFYDDPFLISIKNKRKKRLTYLMLLGATVVAILLLGIFWLTYYSHTHSLEYYMQHKRYDDAIAKFNETYHTDGEKYAFFSQIICNLCKEQKFEEANSYVQVGSGYFPTGAQVKPRFNEIILSYGGKTFTNEEDKPKTITYEELMRKGKYEDALEVFDESYRGNETRFKFIRNCIVRMCQNGEKTRALRFLNSSLGNFPDYDKGKFDNQYSKKTVKETLTELINSY